jgi:hypothetical protein
MNRTSAFSEGNSEAQVHRPPRTWNLKSEAIRGISSQWACSICHQYSASTPLFLLGRGNIFINSGIDQGILPHRNLIPFLDRVREMGGPISFPGSKRRYLQFSSYLVWHSKLLVHANNITIYLARACRAKPMRPWVLSWDRLPIALPIGSGHLLVMMWMDITFTH